LLWITVVWLAGTLLLWQLQRRGCLHGDYYRDALALGALGLATAGFFWRLLFTSGVWMPVGGGDLVSFLYPLYSFVARSLRVGNIPLWNPYLYGGAPFVADNQSGVFYPPNLLFFLLQPGLNYRAMEWLSVAHFYLAGVCAYFGLRYMVQPPLKRLAALAGALAFMFSDLFVTHFGNLNMIACAAWLPLIFCLFRRALVGTPSRVSATASNPELEATAPREVGGVCGVGTPSRVLCGAGRRPAFAVGAGVLLGFAALAGHIQPLLYIVLTLGLYFLYHVYTHRNQSRRALLNAMCLLALTLVIALGVAALSLLPSYEMSRLSLRTDLGYEQASQYSLPPVGLIGLLVPAVFGRGPGGYWGPWLRVEVGYVGILPLLLAGLAVLFRRDGLTRFLALLAVLATLLAFGGASILHGWLYRFVPGFDLVRAPARFIYLLDFALAALAALGLDVLLRPIPHPHRLTWRKVLHISPLLGLSIAIVTLPVAYATLLYSQDKETVFNRLLASTSGVIFALLLLGCGIVLLYWRSRRLIRPVTLAMVICALILIDLASLGAYTELELNDPTAGFQHPAAIAFLKSDPSTYRIDTRTEVSDVWQPDLSLLHNIADVWGIYNPLVLADFNHYWESLGSRSSRLYDFLNAKYIVAHKDVVLDWNKYELAFDGDPQVNIYRNQDVLPRAFVVQRSQSVADHEQAFAAIHQSDFDPATAAVVEHGRTLAPEAPGPADAQIVSYSNNEIRVEASTSLPGYLVMSEVYYPGWVAEVDGRRVELLRANYAFRAVFLSEGTHQVRFSFQPVTWKVGLACSLITWAVLAILTTRALVLRWRRR
jgi:hypothetical protein